MALRIVVLVISGFRICGVAIMEASAGILIKSLILSKYRPDSIQIKI